MAIGVRIDTHKILAKSPQIEFTIPKKMKNERQHMCHMFVRELSPKSISNLMIKCNIAHEYFMLTSCHVLLKLHCKLQTITHIGK